MEKDSVEAYEDIFTAQGYITIQNNEKKLMLAHKPNIPPCMSSFMVIFRNGDFQSLNISSCGLGIEHARPVFNLIEENFPHLIKLDISNNSLNENGCRALSNALKKNTHLKKIAFYKNDISEQGYLDFLKMLKEQHSLQYIDYGTGHMGSLDNDVGLNKDIRGIIDIWLKRNCLIEQRFTPFVICTCDKKNADSKFNGLPDEVFPLILSFMCDDIKKLHDEGCRLYDEYLQKKAQSLTGSKS